LSSAAEPALARIPPPFFLIRLTAVAALVPFIMRRGLPWLQRWTEPKRSVSVSDDRADVLVGQYGRWVDAVIRRGQPVVRRGCLTHGVTLYYGLRRRGIDVSLVFGIGPVNGAMEGHCWIELDGQPVLEPADPRAAFTEVTRISRFGVTGGALPVGLRA
jgi:hypothetical protein